jgi:hypothetical protein
MRHLNRQLARSLLAGLTVTAGAAVVLLALVRPLTGATQLTAASPQLYSYPTDTFAAIGSLIYDRYSATATLLGTGNVLIAGGLDLGGLPVAEAELYDDSSATFVPAAGMIVPRVEDSAVLLSSGAVLFAGGIDSSGAVIGAAELYDPSAGDFEPTGAMISPRTGHSATLLPGGTVLVTGGVGANGTLVTTAEIYDPQSASFSGTGAQITPRSGHAATLLNNGSVLITGGVDANDDPIGGAELYDPTTATFSPAGAMLTARTGHTATLLNDGTVLIAGGTDVSGSPIFGAEIYDPVAGSFEAGASLITARAFHTATLLTNGDVLVAGGLDASGNVLANAELYDLSGTEFVADGAMSTPHVGHAASILQSGDVLIAGGTQQPFGSGSSPFTPTAAPTATPTATATPGSTPTPTPVPVALTFSPKTLTFPAQVLLGGKAATSQPLMLKITNPKTKKQDVPVVIESYLTTGDFAVDSTSTTCGQVLAPGTKCRVAVTFTPSSTGRATGSLTVETNAAKGAPVKSSLSGTGRIGKLAFAPASVNFGSHRLKRPSFHTIIFKNSNPLPITITSIQVTKDGKDFDALLATNGCVGTLAAGAKCGLLVAFEPKTAGTYTGLLKVTDDAAGSPQKITLSGTGK